MTDLSIEMARAGYGLGDLSDAAAFHLFKCAFLSVGVVVGRDFPEQPIEQCNNMARYFASAQEVMALYEAPGLWGVPEALYGQLKVLNVGFVKDTQKKSAPEQLREAVGPVTTAT